MRRTTEQVCDTLRKNNMVVNHIGGSQESYLLHHELTDEQFHEVMVNLLIDHNLKAEDEKLFPGNPCSPQEPNDKSMDAFGYYVQPVNPTEYEDDYGDFQMFISHTELTWC